MNQYIKEYGKKTNLGLTNDNYLLEYNQQTYFVRIPNQDVAELFNPLAEYELLKQADQKGLTLSPVFFNKKNGLLTTRYEANLKTFDDYKESDRISRVVKIMKAFHQADFILEHDFNPLNLLNQYQQKAQTDFDLEPYQELLNQVETYQKTIPKRVCHNDWVEGNICFVEDKTYVIDFEYAGNNDPFFDVMSFYTENNLSKQEKKEYLKLMFPNGVSDEEHQRLIVYRDFNNLLWLHWAMMMDRLRDQAIYKEIIHIKKKQLIEEYQKPVFV